MLAVSPDDHCQEAHRDVPLSFGSEPEARLPAPIRPESHRLQLGPVVADIVNFTKQRSVRITPSTNVVHLAAPFTGAMTAVNETGTQPVAPGTALLIGQRERTDCVWSAGATGLVLHVSRAAVQAQTFAAFQEPRRLGNVTLPLDISEPGSTLHAAISTVMMLSPAKENAATGDAIIAGLVDTLCLSEDTAGALPVAASVKRAIDHLRRDGELDCSLEKLARSAGITLPVLRRNFKDCLGITLTQFVLDARLDWGRARLTSSTESRSIAQLAVAAGLTGAGVFTRAYQRKFGETPTQSRARTFTTRR